MEFFVTSLIAMPISTFYPGKYSTISYGDFCFVILEVHHIFFQAYHILPVTGIRNKYLATIVLVWRYCNKHFVVDYFFCDVVCILFFGGFLYVAILFFVIVHFSIIAFLLLIFFLVALLFFFLDYLAIVFLDMNIFPVVVTLWYVHTFYVPALLWLVPISLASCEGTLVFGFYIEVFFIFYWCFYSWLLVHLFISHWNLSMGPLDS